MLAQIVAYLAAGGTASTATLRRDLGLSRVAIRAALAAQPWYQPDLAVRTALLCLAHGAAVQRVYTAAEQPMRAVAETTGLALKDVHAVVHALGIARELRDPALTAITVTADAPQIVRQTIAQHGVRGARQLLPNYDVQTLTRLSAGAALPRRTRTALDDAAVRAQYAAGATVAGLAHDHGVSRATIRRSLRRTRAIQTGPPTSP